MACFTMIYLFIILCILGWGAGQQYEPLLPSPRAHSHSRRRPQPSPVALHAISFSPENGDANFTPPQHNKTLNIRSASVPLVALDLEICLQLSINAFGRKVLNLGAVAHLGALIEEHGVSVQQLSIVQASVLSQLTASAKAATTAYACQTSGKSEMCEGFSFDHVTHKCTLHPKQLTTTSKLLARIIGQLSLEGSSSSEYCSLCPKNCVSTPSSVAVHHKRSRLALGLCPEKLDACPINMYSPSDGYECIDTTQELTSCGGCATTNHGIDCTQIPGVSYVSCREGRCEAHSCKENFRLTWDKTCV